MLGINTKVVSNHLTIHPSAKLVAQRKQNIGNEKMAVIDVEVSKLFNVRFITKTKYPNWLANMVANSRWHIYVDFTEVSYVLRTRTHYQTSISLSMDPLGYHNLS
ncbi:unnamed protein product [Vicia faba]|uniref:Uncharacterized protein n=1 Tax=Vicia faba TaxID=3906 RepID=A0AAV0ZT39_VICFA|nr:unnamed protein product [Vicia faba]